MEVNLIIKISLMVIGVCLLIFGGVIARSLRKCYPNESKRLSGTGSAFDQWALRVGGLVFVVVGFLVSGENPWPWRTIMSRDENLIVLLEKGEIVEGRVAKVFYQRGAPEGWRLDYKFDANDPGTNSLTTYVGSAQGPRRYYAYLKPGETIAIIYYPSDPWINCEIRQLVNDPTYRFTFKKAGKLHLLDRFRNEYEVEDISFKEWCKQQWQK